MRVRANHPILKHDAFIQNNPHRKTIRVAKAPGRNDACTCGSGAKFKNCCANRPDFFDRLKSLFK